MLGKNSPQYRVWADHAAKLKNMPYGCQVVNTGSTSSFKAFDYGLWELRGVNLGFQPQPLYYDFETLKKYSGHIAKGAKILIGIEGFKFLVDAYANEATDHKYYLWLNNEQIRTYKRCTKWLIDYAPAVLHPNFLRSEVKYRLKKFLRKENWYSGQKGSASEKEDIDWARHWTDGWNKQFAWERGQTIREDQLTTIAINEKRLSDMIDYCFDYNWIPYLVVLPFSPNLVKLLSEEVLNPGLWEPLERVRRAKGVQCINLYYDKRFSDVTLYADALTLNETGRRRFNSVIQQEIGLKGSTHHE